MKKFFKINIITLMLLINFTSFATIHDVQIVGNTFSPQNIQIEAGDIVRWTNNGGFHNIEANDGSFKCSDSCEVTTGDGNGSASSTWTTVEVTFNSVGVFNYLCETHVAAGMIGNVTVNIPTSSTVHTIQTDGLTFVPDDITIAPGDIVNFRNISGLHNVRADDDSFLCSEGCLGVGTNLSSAPSSANWNIFLSFEDTGDFPYFCEQHQLLGMTGIIRVDGDLIFANNFE